MENLIKKVLREELINNKITLTEGVIVSENLNYHIEKGLSLTENIFRPLSDEFFNLINEARVRYENGEIDLPKNDIWLVKTDIGKTAIYEGSEVWLDVPFINEDELINEAEYQGKKVELNKPKRGGTKKFYVYTRNPKTGKVVKVSFGAKSGIIFRNAIIFSSLFSTTMTV